MSRSSDEEQLAAECYALAYARADMDTMQDILHRAHALPELAYYVLAVHGRHTHQGDDPSRLKMLETDLLLLKSCPQARQGAL